MNYVNELKKHMLTSDNFTYNKELHQYIWKAIERYVVIDKIGGESFGGWKGFSHIRFNNPRSNYVKSYIFIINLLT